jgi:hypothetical protein
MKATLIVEGKEFPIEIQDPELQKLLKPPKKTGYEKVGEGHTYSYVDTYGEIKTLDHQDFDDDKRYDDCNYYSDYFVAEGNAWADKLMRQLRRFAVEHRKDQLYWAREYCNKKWSIVYDCKNKMLRSGTNWDVREAFAIYFDSEEAANLAIETFHDELIWYFTEYKDSL